MTEPTDLARAEEWFRVFDRDYPGLSSVLLAEYDRRGTEVDRLRGHILDIDAHATPFADLPEEPGYVGAYLLSAGALHRALGTIGHTAPSCTAEAELTAARAQRDAVLVLHHRESNGYVSERGTCSYCRDSDEEPSAWPCDTARALGVES